jgi:hypothetical protein
VPYQVLSTCIASFVDNFSLPNPPKKKNRKIDFYDTGLEIAKKKYFFFFSELSSEEKLHIV